MSSTGDNQSPEDLRLNWLGHIGSIGPGLNKSHELFSKSLEGRAGITDKH